MIALRWGPSAFARTLLGVSGLTLVLGLALARPDLVALAAVPSAWIMLSTGRREPTAVEVTVQSPERCVENEPAEVLVLVRCDDPADLLRVTFAPAPGIRAAESVPLSVTTVNSPATRLATTVLAGRWGRQRLGHVTVECWTRGRLLRASVTRSVRQPASVYPRPEPLRHLTVAAARLDRSGDHVATVAGAGVEFHSVRRFTRGDRPRAVNWPVSTRRGELYVTATRAEQAVDTIVAVDVLTDLGPAGRSSRDLALRGATGIVQAVLRSHDRVGLVVVGGRLKWLRPDHTQRQFYRIADAILEVVDWDSFIDPDVHAIPYRAMPFGAEIFYLSPLVDRRAVEAARVLRVRGHPVRVIDICVQEPQPHPPDEAAVRLWRADRQATANRLAAMGITISRWDGTLSLHEALTPLRPRR